MSAAYRVLLVNASASCRSLLQQWLQGADMVLDDSIATEQLTASIARRAPDLIVLDIGDDLQSVIQAGELLKTNPTTVLLPLLGVSRSPQYRLAAIEAGVDDYLTHDMQREEFQVRARALLRVSAARRQLAAEQLAEEVNRREHIAAAFRRYVSPKLADQIMANPQLRDMTLSGPQLRSQVAVMFADMRGFTALAEKLEPQLVVKLLNEFIGLLTDITFEYDGTVFSMAGDSLLVGFGVPMPQSDGVERAVLAGKAMLTQFAAQAERWHGQYGVPTGLGIGINVGEVIAGNIGSAAYMNYTIIGDTVNVASRLGQRARAGEMLFSAAVKSLLDEHGVDVGAQELPALVLRGRTRPIGIYCLPSQSRLDLRAS